MFLKYTNLLACSGPQDHLQICPFTRKTHKSWLRLADITAKGSKAEWAQGTGAWAKDGGSPGLRLQRSSPRAAPWDQRVPPAVSCDTTSEMVPRWEARWKVSAQGFQTRYPLPSMYQSFRVPGGGGGAGGGIPHRPLCLHTHFGLRELRDHSGNGRTPP